MYLDGCLRSIAHHQTIELGWQSKYYVEVFDRQQLAHPVIYPLVTLCSTAIRAVPVTTTMILMMDMMTCMVITTVCVDTQPYGMAFL